MPQTLAQKIIARAAGKAEVAVGEIEIGSVDLAMIHDSGGPRRVAPILERLGVEVWDPEKLVVVTDHYVPVFDAESRAILDLARDWVKKQGVARFHDEEGICHVVLPENGYLKPGMFAVGGDSHSPTGGAFGCYMFGIGATEMAGVLATGEIWIQVPETIRIEWEGTFQKGVMAKDVMLFLCGRLGMDGGRYQAVEYCGEAVSELSMQERMTLSNMSAELGAQAGLIAPDATTMKWLEEHGAESDQIEPWQTDPDSDFECHRFDADQLEPQVAAPHSPANAASVLEYNDIRPDVDENGGLDWGAFGTVDFRRLVNPDRSRTNAEKLRDELKDVLLMLDIVKERIPGREKYLVLKHLRMGWIEFEHIEDEDMRAMARWYLRARRLRRWISKLEEDGQRRRQERLKAFLE